MYTGKTVYIGFTTIQAFRYPLESWNIISSDEEGLLYLLDLKENFLCWSLVLLVNKETAQRPLSSWATVLGDLMTTRKAGLRRKFKYLGP